MRQAYVKGMIEAGALITYSTGSCPSESDVRIKHQVNKEIINQVSIGFGS